MTSGHNETYATCSRTHLTTAEAGRLVDYFAHQHDCHEIRTTPVYRATLAAHPDLLAGWYVMVGIQEIGSSHGYLLGADALGRIKEASYGVC